MMRLIVVAGLALAMSGCAAETPVCFRNVNGELRLAARPCDAPVAQPVKR